MVGDFKSNPVAGYVLRQRGRRQSQDGKHHGAECIGRTFVLRHAIGVVGSVVIPGYLQNDAILEADKLQAARIGFRLLGGVDSNETAEVKRKRKFGSGDGLVERFQLGKIGFFERFQIGIEDFGRAYLRGGALRGESDGYSKTWNKQATPNVFSEVAFHVLQSEYLLFCGILRRWAAGRLIGRLGHAAREGNHGANFFGGEHFSIGRHHRGFAEGAAAQSDDVQHEFFAFAVQRGAIVQQGRNRREVRAIGRAGRRGVGVAPDALLIKDALALGLLIAERNNFLRVGPIGFRVERGEQWIRFGRFGVLAAAGDWGDGH